jgi:putative transcriptional regulator
MGMDRRGAVLALASVMSGVMAGAQAPQGRGPEFAPGKLLVASRGLADPNFVQTVIVLVQVDPQGGVLGLVINDRTDVPLAKALADFKSAKGRQDTLYVGGPVGKTGILALVRSRTKPESGEHIVGDVYLVSTRTVLEKFMEGAKANGSRGVRVYAGYAGWTLGQLRMEVRAGAWHVFPGDASAIFDSDPDGLWRRLIRKTEQEVARVRARWRGH